MNKKLKVVYAIHRKKIKKAKSKMKELRSKAKITAPANIKAENEQS
jgi:hypothetical protein